jgi:photolyase PhrII
MTQLFHPLLAERLRALNGNKDDLDQARGDFVIYWMRTAARIHDNPGLKAAVEFANATDRPVFIYHGVSESYPYAADRHHQFILEGAKDVAAKADEFGIGYALHVERDGHRREGLRQLCERAGAVFVEERPVEPGLTWTHALASAVDTPVIALDCDCIVPMRIVPTGLDRAYKYRNETEHLRQDRLAFDWNPPSPEVGSFLPDDLFFEPVDMQTTPVSTLVSACDIDHSVGPVPGRRGGRVAGYERWNEFHGKYLDIYHKLRNNPTRPEAVSRMSPYLHFGHVSPFRLAREALASDADGADKYIDEMVTWREMSHYFCFRHRNHDSFDVLPDWAWNTLRAHESDSRDDIYSWETLAEAKTDDQLWNLCQEWLLRHGELHNNVRMTWAKKLLEWTETPQRALEVAIDLNHRYALDGRDPCSYLGILWCFGAFDRPYDKERPIIGRVRPRDSDWHKGRINMEKLENIIAQPTGGVSRRIAIIGAGIAGTAAAQTLRSHGLDVEIFEKSRGPGGRTATRYLNDNEQITFDHGAQYFTARDERFRRLVSSWQADGLVAEWKPDIGVYEDGELTAKPSETTRWVGTPKMNQMAKHLAENVEVHYQTTVTEIDSSEEGAPVLRIDNGEDPAPFDFVVCTPPPEQSFDLLAEEPPLTMRPTWAVMLQLNRPIDCPYDGVFVNNGPINWIAKNSSKPEREGETWVIHAESDWSDKNLEQQPGEVAERLLTVFEDILEVELPEHLGHVSAHRWRYARPAKETDRGFIRRLDGRVLLAGDWLRGGRIEGAFLSGRQAAGEILRRHKEAIEGTFPP